MFSAKNDILKNPQQTVSYPTEDTEDFLNEYTLIKIHGTLMLFAWFGSASIGIIVARYFKRTWVKHKVFGVELWFFLHRMFMLITWSFTMIGFAVIFIDMDGWANLYLHEIFGLITTIVCFVHPIIAVFRPNIDSQKRKYFNILHAIVGSGSYGLAVITIFLAVPLEDAALPHWMNWIMTCFLTFHLIFHILSYKTDVYVARGDPEENILFDEPFSINRQIALYIYIGINMAFVLTLVIVLALSKKGETALDSI